LPLRIFAGPLLAEDNVAHKRKTGKKKTARAKEKSAATFVAALEFKG
jgi:hypothetical protein